eukprot:CAMPEP_0204824734 /NCGR_PEP_ID=MMETSP1346-20131115/2724_1 /ASSEMBLY_ACC=CAM_ASM_000771 /TAXON_ID=215587 /ORGANISM="Aplanochytrium stocchinoi, Strain GSBS06" /LENGTH=217 /DNA_ID=CAMNT_0051952045 /DNA_START=222 /DNA_END=876 /DNA_ORIENTATION=-
MGCTETFVPIIATGQKLKRLIMFGDCACECPPPSGCRLPVGPRYELTVQSEFVRFLRLGVPLIVLPDDPANLSMLNLVPKVGADLSLFKINVSGQRVKLREINEQHCNPGFQHIWQCVDVSDYEGKGEDEPLPDVFNNLGEAEYIVSVFQYMIILGYKPQHISIITPFNGQKHLIVDIMRKRCMDIGLPMPGQILTFDAAQGMQNESSWFPWYERMV